MVAIKIGLFHNNHFDISYHNKHVSVKLNYNPVIFSLSVVLVSWQAQ